ncbi:hypothetical protein [Nitrospira moscoviensis]|uniref:Uncharacterized protein n=1 Tax=Nitrospira moscoviensis TaxID=42253 RepID=A0A0K2G9Y8_NITMO|nr:hypothetical protein [Nitrospira moscoviensis]ALA57684.1 hypothetical protein NITMOv2_1256 [Nitrospira moscoviensis]
MRLHPYCSVLLTLLLTIVLNDIALALNAKKDPTVVDVSNTVVGEVVGISAIPSALTDVAISAAVALDIPGQSMVAHVSSAQFFGNARVIYDQPNCTGQAYFNAAGLLATPRVFPIIGIGAGGFALYIPRPNTMPVTITAQGSSWDFTGVCNAGSATSVVRPTY